MSFKNSSGNALFLILIAVALFAALSFAMTQSRGSSDISDEKMELKLGEIFTYFAEIDQAIVKLRAFGVPFEELSIESADRKAVDGSTALRENYLCTVDSCKIFSPDGGGVIYKNFYEIAQLDPLPAGYGSGWLKPGEMSAWLIPIDGLGTSETELVIFIAAVQEDVCKAYNQKFDLPDLITTNTGTRLIFHHDNTDDPGFDTYTGTVAGQMAFCARRPSASVPFYNLFHVAVVR